MNEEFRNKMIELAKKIDIELSDKQINQYYEYMKLLLEWNEKINLTAITEMEEIILKHFIDSMTVLKYINQGENIVDVGTGAGFPGIPIAIMMPDVQVTLLDSLNKRITFLNEVIKCLELKNVKTIHGRAEDLGQNKKTREMFNVAISRAVANMSTLTEYLLPVIKKKGICICMKGSEIEQELQESKYAIKELGGKIEKVESLELPNSEMKRNIIIIKKEKETPKKYPRKAGMPSKQPLKQN